MWHVCIQYTHTYTHLHTYSQFSVVSEGKTSAGNVGNPGSILGLGRSPGEEMATHSSTLSWKIPWTENPGRLQSMGLQRIEHDWVTSLFTLIQLLSSVQLFETPWTAAHQASLSITNPELAKLVAIEYPTISSSVVPFSSCLQSLSASGAF